MESGKNKKMFNSTAVELNVSEIGSIGLASKVRRIVNEKGTEINFRFPDGTSQAWSADSLKNLLNQPWLAD